LLNETLMNFHIIGAIIIIFGIYLSSKKKVNKNLTKFLKNRKSF